MTDSYWWELNPGYLSPRSTVPSPLFHQNTRLFMTKGMCWMNDWPHPYGSGHSSSFQKPPRCYQERKGTHFHPLVIIMPAARTHSDSKTKRTRWQPSGAGVEKTILTRHGFRESTKMRWTSLDGAVCGPVLLVCRTGSHPYHPNCNRLLKHLLLPALSSGCLFIGPIILQAFTSHAWEVRVARLVGE